MEQNLTKMGRDQVVVHPDSGLTSTQEKCALLLAAGVRISEVAKQVGTSRGTLYRWLDLPAFQCFFNMVKKEMKQYVEGSLLEMHQQALDGIKASLGSQREEVRLRASVWVVDRICQMQIGETQVREVLKEETFGRQGYLHALDESGLEE